MNALDAELAIDRLEARLATELPAHIAASAQAYAGGGSGPGALDVTHREVAAVLAARSVDALRPRGTRLLRVIAPIVIDAAPRVIAARSLERTWASWRVLAAAREAHARLRFGVSHRSLAHALAGVSTTPVVPGEAVSGSEHGPPRDLLAPIAEWTREQTGDGPLPDDAVRAAWNDLARGDTLGSLSIHRSESAHPRTFVVERGARAVIILPTRIDTPAARFAVLHELGHALLWLSPISRDHEWPRAIDEAAASYVARALEGGRANDDGVSITGWHAPHAMAARKRRLAIARVLHAIEIGGEPGDIERPPWALWNDPFAQAAYVEAERIADAMPAGLRGRALAEHLAPLAAAVDAVHA